MKKYVKPEARIIALDGNDVITASPPDVIWDGTKSAERHAFLDLKLPDWAKDGDDDWTKGFKG